MPRTLLFDKSGLAEEIRLAPHILDKRDENLTWINLSEDEDLKSIIPDAINTSSSSREDLVEEQRPRVSLHQTLEDNDDTYSVIVVSVPTRKLFTEDDFQLQITFILLRNKIYSLASRPNNTIGDIMAKVVLKNKQFNLTSLFNYILIELFEMGIRVLNQIEDYTDELEKQIIRSSLSNKLLTSLLVLKSRLFDASKLIKADLEFIREIMNGEVPELDSEEITDQPEDRSLFLLDLIETQREDLSNIINLHLAIASNNMNKQFYWLTILASILVVPTVISSIWGMNIPVPQINFWLMMLIMFIITGLSALILKYFLPKPHLV